MNLEKNQDLKEEVGKRFGSTVMILHIYRKQLISTHDLKNEIKRFLMIEGI